MKTIINYPERIELLILDLSNQRMTLAEKIKQRIVANSSVDNAKVNFLNWNTPEVIFSFWHRSKLMDQHIADLNLWLTYKLIIDKLQQINYDNRKNETL